MQEKRTVCVWLTCEIIIFSLHFQQVFSYRFTDLAGGWGPARLSVWPSWPLEGESPKSTTPPLSDLEEGAIEFDLWKEIGEELLTTSTGVFS